MTSVLAFNPLLLDDAADVDETADVSVASGTHTDDADVSTRPTSSVRVRALKRAAKRLDQMSPIHELDLDHPTEQGQHQAEDAPVLEFPQVLRRASRQASERFVALQEWEGYVVSIEKATFTATLRDVTAGTMIEEEEAEFPREDVAETDEDLLALGAVFRWVIGYETKAGTRRRVSQIVFRRLPQWTKNDIEGAKRHAIELAGSIRWE